MLAKIVKNFKLTAMSLPFFVNLQPKANEYDHIIFGTPR